MQPTLVTLAISSICAPQLAAVAWFCALSKYVRVDAYPGLGAVLHVPHQDGLHDKLQSLGAMVLPCYFISERT